MKNNETKTATAPKAVAVAKQSKNMIDPKTGKETIAMSITLYERDSDDFVKNKDLEDRIRNSICRTINFLSREGFKLLTREDAEEFDELIEETTCWPVQILSHDIDRLAEACSYLDIRATITLNDNSSGIRQINISNFCEYNIVTENCFKHMDDKTDLLSEKSKFFGEKGELVKSGSKLLCSYRIGDCFSVFYDAIDLNSDVKRLASWFENV